MSTEKHVNWFALEKACGKPGCPVCTIVNERSERYIDNMLFEHVSDRGFRKIYRESGGFCSKHAQHLDSFRDGLAVAILGVDILTNTLTSLKKGSPRKSKGVCPACAETARIEREFLGYIADTNDSAFSSFFTASEGLCIPHYRKMLTLVRRLPVWLKEFHHSRFDSLLERSRAFIEYSAWGRQEDFEKLPANDKIVWKELARTLRGNTD